jgi:hypothetical protein
MKGRGLTISELRWPDTPDFVAIARIWKSDASTILLSCVWQGYDLLQNEVLSQIDSDQADDELERSITQLLEPRIHKVMTGDEPFYVQHEVYEYATRQPPPAQPPQYDIAFVLYENPRIMWPLEAKVLRSNGAVTSYIRELKNNFLSCRYAPFSSEGAMLGYLFSGVPDNVFRHIETKVPCELHHHLAFPERAHKYSEHTRRIPTNKSYPPHFRCQHLILQMTRE